MIVTVTEFPRGSTTYITCYSHPSPKHLGGFFVPPDDASSCRTKPGLRVHPIHVSHISFALTPSSRLSKDQKEIWRVMVWEGCLQPFIILVFFALASNASQSCRDSSAHGSQHIRGSFYGAVDTVDHFRGGVTSSSCIQKVQAVLVFGEQDRCINTWSRAGWKVSVKFSSTLLSKYTRMRFSKTLVCALGLISSAFAQSSSVDSYISTEDPIAKAGLLANIGPSGSKTQGAKVHIFHCHQRSGVHPPLLVPL